MNNEVLDIDLFSPNFDFSTISKENFKKAYHIAVRENQDDIEKLIFLNDLNQKAKKYYNNKVDTDVIVVPTNDTLEHQEYIPGTNILRPRGRGIFESDEDYVNYLRDYYEENLRVQYNLIMDTNQKNSGNEVVVSDGPRVVPIKETERPVNINSGLPGPADELERPVNINSGLPGPVLKEAGRTPKKGLITIINELTTGLEIEKKTGGRYAASNIHVVRNFMDELHSGNVIYNVVHLAPNVVKSAAMFANKMFGKITLSKKQKENMIILRDRIDSMTDEDLMTVYNEYRGSRVIQERFPSAINLLLQERIGKFTLDNLTKLNDENINGYQEIFASYQQVNAINEMLRNPALTDDQRNLLNRRKNHILDDKIGLIQKIRNNYIEANQWMSGGEHGFSEDMKAAATKLSITGKRFAKDHDLDNELLEREAYFEKVENKAIAENNPEVALEAFVGMEKLLSSETSINKSVFGNRSTGKKYYSPLAKQLDYRDDPFIKDVFTTMAVVGAGVSAYNALKTHGVEADNVIRQQQAEATRVNDLNNTTMNQVNQTGQNIVDERGTFTEGMKAQQQFDVNNFAMTQERQSLDENGWVISSDSYHQADALSHAATGKLYNSVEKQIKSITNQYTSGGITQVEAMEAISKLSKQTQASFKNVIDSYLPSLESYASTHPQFDLDGALGSLQYIQQHPDAIINMNQAMIDTTNMGESLIGLTAAQVRALDSLPSDMRTTLFGAATAGALAYKVATATQNGRRNRKYGDEITRMVEEAVQNDEAMTNTHKNSR